MCIRDRQISLFEISVYSIIVKRPLLAGMFNDELIELPAIDESVKLKLKFDSEAAPPFRPETEIPEKPILNSETGNSQFINISKLPWPSEYAILPNSKIPTGQSVSSKIYSIQFKFASSISPSSQFPSPSNDSDTHSPLQSTIPSGQSPEPPSSLSSGPIAPCKIQ